MSKLYNLWQILKGSLWFVPAIFCVVYFTATIGLYTAESKYLPEVRFPGILFNGDIEGAKAVTNSLMTSMITMTTLVISITVVVLSMAASQLGPRLIKTFMSDGKTQNFIGLFFGAVITCFVLTMILHEIDADAFLPKITISTVFAVCFANLFVLLAFVHHVAQSSIADNVILKVSAALNRALERLTIGKHEKPLHAVNLKPSWPTDFDQQRKHIYFSRSGYIQHIDYDNIAALACRHDLMVEITFKAGHFLVEGEDGVRIYPARKMSDAIEKQIRDCFIVGQVRTPTQDVDYSIRHLVEIAIRALSPGINDSFTAITVLDHISAAVAVLFQRETPSEWIPDQAQAVRIKARQSGEDDILFNAFDQIRHSGRAIPAISWHILKKMDILADLARTTAQKEALQSLLEDVAFDMKAIRDKTRHMDDIDGLQQQIHDKLAR